MKRKQQLSEDVLLLQKPKKKRKKKEVNKAIHHMSSVFHRGERCHKGGEVLALENLSHSESTLQPYHNWLIPSSTPVFFLISEWCRIYAHIYMRIVSFVHSFVPDHCQRFLFHQTSFPLFTLFHSIPAKNCKHESTTNRPTLIVTKRSLNPCRTRISLLR